MAAPTLLSQVYATDEDVAIRACGDYPVLCPEWQKLAAGTDGVISSGTPWVLTSSSVNFQTNGVASNCVVILYAPKSSFAGGGELFAIDSATGGSMMLRRLGQALNMGQPPAPAAGLTAVAFKVKTLAQQIEDASYDLNQRFGIDPNQPYRDTTFVYDLRILRQLCVLTVLQRQYTNEARGKDGDFMEKLKRVNSDLNDLLDRSSLRWGQFGNSSPPVGRFSTRLTR